MYYYDVSVNFVYATPICLLEKNGSSEIKRVGLNQQCEFCRIRLRFHYGFGFESQADRIAARKRIRKT
jgi:hypothetical protein